MNTMNKYDWIMVGMVIYGIYLIVQGILGLVGTVLLPTIDGLGATNIRTSAIVLSLLTSFMGTCLVLLPLKFDLAVLERKRMGNGNRQQDLDR